MELYGGIVLHSTSNHLGILDSFSPPYKEELVGVVVESTFNWYWLADLLMDQGYRVYLAHKLARAAYFVMRDQVPFECNKLFA